MHRSLQASLYQQLEKEPEKPAIAFYNNRDEFQWFTREQFYGLAAGYASGLNDYGLRRGEICLLVLPSGAFCAKMILAVLNLGAVPLLIAPPFLQGNVTNSSLLKILTDVIAKTKAKLVICPENMAAMQEDLQQSHRECRFLFGEKDLKETPDLNKEVIFPPETAIAAMQLTSGTTGSPRICVWQQSSVLAALDGMIGAMKLNEKDVCLNWTPLYHDMGLVNNFFLCLYTGVPLVMLSPHDFVMNPAIWMRALSNTGATTTWSPNFGFALAAKRINDEELQNVRLDKVRAFWNAAERIHLETMLAFHQRFEPYGVKREALKTNFGCAENIGGATFGDPDGLFTAEYVHRELLQNDWIAKPVDPSNKENSIAIVSVGRPFPGMKVHILSEQGDRLPEGQVGEVALETPSRMLGYKDDPEATSRAIFGNLLRTGDLGYIRNGELFWVGRIQERITVRGVKLDPSDFETVLLQVSGLRQGCFVAFGVDDEAQGTQRIVVVSEVRENTDRKPSEIAADIGRLSLLSLGIKINEILLVRQNTLTKTSSGKRRHRHFRQLYLEGKLQAFAWQPDKGDIPKAQIEGV